MPNTAKPVCWLHNLAFTNAIANVAANDGSDTLVLGQGDSVVEFSRGTKAPFIGYKYRVTDASGTPHTMAMVAPLTSEHGLHGSPYAVDSATTSDGSTNVNLPSATRTNQFQRHRPEPCGRPKRAPSSEKSSSEAVSILTSLYSCAQAV